AKGNLVDKNGKIIAKAGPERRIAEEKQRLQARVRHLDAENAKMRQELVDRNFLNGLPAKYNLSNDDVARFMQFMAVGKASPIEGVRLVIAEAVKQGITLEQILGEDGAGVRSIDARAITSIIDERLKPIS